MIGDHVVTVEPVTGGDPVDVSCLVDEVSIHHGRDDTDSQPEAASATLTISLDADVETLPTELEVSAVVRVSTVVLGTSYPRFVGKVTDVAIGWESAGEDTPDRQSVQVIAVSTLADLGRRTVGDVPWPQELDGARVSRIMAAAGVPLDPLVSDPGTVAILPRDVDSQAALGIAQDVAANGRGVVWHTTAGEVRYADSDHRRNADPVLTLDACDVLVTPVWRRTTEGLVNDVSIGYGPQPAEGEQPRYLADNPTSVGRFGRYDLSTATQLAALADATAMGQLLLVRNSSPVWVMDELPVDLAGLDAERTVVLLGLDMHALVELTGLPAAGTAPTSAALWVEGWSETLAYGVHELRLSVSGYCRTAPAPRWDDIAPGWTWDAMGDTTWDDTTCLGPLPDYGRWSDVPASLRWDVVPPATTWDTYR